MKNKLSTTTSRSGTTADGAAKNIKNKQNIGGSAHKRVRSDAFESKGYNRLLPHQLVNSQQNNPQRSLKTLPKRMKAASHEASKKQSQRISPNMHMEDIEGQPPQVFFQGAFNLDGDNSNKKLVNVSIDLINEPEVSDEVSNNSHSQKYNFKDGGQWFEVEQSTLENDNEGDNRQHMILQMHQNTAATKVMNSGNQSQISYDENQNIYQNDKTITKSYFQKQNANSEAMSIQDNSSLSPASVQFKPNHQKQSSDVLRLEKYKHMLAKAKGKFQSKSEIPPNKLIKENNMAFYQEDEVEVHQKPIHRKQNKSGFLLEQDMSQSPARNQVITFNQNYINSDAFGYQQNTQNQNKRHLHQSKEDLASEASRLRQAPPPSQIQKDYKEHKVKDQKQRSGTDDKNMMDFKQMDPTPTPQSQVNQNQVKLAGTSVEKDNQEMFAPLNSMNFSVSNQGQPSSSKQPVQERIETQDSIANDPEISPRTKATKKLTKHIKTNFKQSGVAPPTTVDFYRVGKILGKGAFGKVNLALHQLTQKMVAIKSINKTYFSEDSQTKKVMQEVIILKQTRQRNIVRLYEYFETQKHILFVIELCAGGDLLNYVRKRRQLKEDVAKSVFKQLIEGLAYCHSKNILHRDIKLDNILLSWNGEVKICDFGVSKIVKRGEKMTEQCGTPAYIAPEILLDRGYEGFAIDIWSAGVVLYAMLYGTVPFKANNMSELQKMIIKAKYKLQDGISSEAQNLLKQLLEKDPSQRITISKIMKHPWMKDAKDKVELFTQAEKNYIKSEFTYNDTQRYNRNETDPFVDQMLDTTQNSILKNAETKSIILAPFNSTKSNLGEIESESYELPSEIRDLIQSKSCIKFAPRVREIEKQYEVNNNAELDNGVYHDFGKDEDPKNNDINKLEQEDSLQSSFNKESSLKSNEDEEARRLRQKSKAKKTKQTELEKLENLINQEEGNIPHQNSTEEKPYQNSLEHSQSQAASPQRLKIANEQQETLDSEGLEHVKRYQLSSSKKLLMASSGETGEAQMLYSEMKPHGHTGQLIANQLPHIEDKIVSIIEGYGYPKDCIYRYLQKHELNYATTSYYLLQNEDPE